MSYPVAWQRDKYLLLVCQSSGKEISASPFGQFQSFAQFGHGGGKLRTVRFAFFSAASISFTSFLPKPQEEVIRNLRPGEVRQEVVRGVEVAVGMQFFHLIQ